MCEYVEKAAVYYHNMNGPRVSSMCHKIVREARDEAKVSL